MFDIEHTKQRLFGFVTNVRRIIFIIGTKSVCNQRNRISFNQQNTSIIIMVPKAVVRAKHEMQMRSMTFHKIQNKNEDELK